jgi:hypothetical protein
MRTGEGNSPGRRLSSRPRQRMLFGSCHGPRIHHINRPRIDLVVNGRATWRHRVEPGGAVFVGLGCPQQIAAEMVQTVTKRPNRPPLHPDAIHKVTDQARYPERSCL